MSSAREFFDAIWSGLEGFAEIRIGSGQPEYFQYPAELDKMIAAADAATDPVHFHSALRKAKTTLPEHVISLSILHQYCLFSEKPRDQWIADLSKAMSFVMEDDGGFHLIWVLDPQVSGKLLETVLLSNRERILFAYIPFPFTGNFFASWHPERKSKPETFAIIPDEHPVSVATSVATLKVSDAVKRVIVDGLPAYIQFRKETDPPAKLEKRKLTAAGADSWVIWSLVAGGHEDHEIYDVFRDPLNKIGDRYRELKNNGDEYIASSIRSAREIARTHPSTSDDSASQKIAKSAEKEFSGADLEIIKIVKTEFKEPLYEVTVRLPGDPAAYTVECVMEQLYKHSEFCKVFFSAHDRVIPSMKMAAWAKKLNDHAHKIVRKKVEKELAGLDGIIEAALNEFLAKVRPVKAAEAVKQLEWAPVRPEDDGEVFFRLTPLLAFTRGQRIEASMIDVVRVLKALRYESVLKRLGDDVIRLWKMPKNDEILDGPEKV